MDEFNNENGRIDRLKRGLYSRKTPDIIDEARGELKKEENNAPHEWQSVEAGNFDKLAAKFSHSASRHHTFAKKFLTISAILFGLSVIVALAVFFGGINSISSKNVDIKVLGPLSVGGGQSALFDVMVMNENNTPLESVKLTVEYPKGVRSPDDATKELTQESFNLGHIDSGDTTRQSLNLLIFGEKEEIKKFNLTVEYQVKNSRALFYKEKVHEISISSAPVIVTSTYPKEVNSNQDITFSIEVASNSGDPMDNFLLNLNYPFGFTFKDASPVASFGNDTWRMSLKSGEKRTIKINGTIAGTNNEERIFKINAGTASPDDERKIGVLFSVSDEGILIKKPFIGVDLRVGGSGEVNVVSSGGAVNSDLKIINNLPERIFNVIVEASLSGGAFSENSIVAGSGGFFQSINDTIVWDKRSIEELSQLDPGSDVSMDFRLTPLSYQSVPSGSTPEIRVKVKVRGERILTSGAVENIESNDERLLRLATNLSLIPKLVRSQGLIENSGPIPPKADQSTTYTVVWTLSNTFNTANSVEIKATLPPYVQWTGLISPKSEDVIFNPTTQEVVWRLNQVVAGAGYKTSPREVMFQISFLPSVSQVNTTPDLLGSASVKGVDKVTNTAVQSSALPLNTRFSSDPTFKEGYDKVAP